MMMMIVYVNVTCNTINNRISGAFHSIYVKRAVKEKRRLQSFAKWSYRRIMKARRIDKVSEKKP